MKKLTAGLFVSLDGVVEAPERWHFPYLNEELGRALGAQIQAADTMLLGRATYEEFAAHWAHQGSEVPFADRINGIPKYVVSGTLGVADWQNTTLLAGPGLAERIGELKRHPGGDISVTGSVTLVRWLLAQGLLDELSLMVHPIVVGAGRRLFDEADTARYPLELVDFTTFSTGVVHLTYRTTA
ncbi:pyrimidine reductase [Kitasatospora sp. MMS16-BH015]|uniref:dihydrofolate reductase family protein n=1 Tax=Kitasatospora sp. MMS16-BH015 TaxID=2018025 RepID=UPI000CA28752|nr:dihydrofolate reductase family protein [Kitasatospora sp. MMS16-BH015]AUG80668.1 pyrimidine reductase [Kitasatospora sp. MMS16-BH015]